MPQETEQYRGHFAPLLDSKSMLLTTFRRDGTPVATPVHVVAHDDVAYFRTFEPSGKMKRMRRNPDVEVAPCSLRGKVRGETRKARVRILEGAESDAAAKALAQKWPIVHGRLIPWFHRRKDLTTIQLELTPR